EQAAAAERAARGASSAGGGGGGGSSSGPGPGVSSGVPPATGRTSSCFGPRNGSFHYGVDIAAPIGTPVYTPLSGRVSRAGAANGFGQAIYITHDNGNVTVYGHVSRIYVSTGQRVYAGQNIGAVGNEGHSTGPHLHFEVHTNGDLYGHAIDPVPWLRNLGIYISGCG
nr:M23 family metallopeptidase [Geodermatophilaceae bacterium]